MYKRQDLSLAINQRLTNVSERVNIEIELGYFSNERRGVNPMQFLNAIKSFNKYNKESWEIKLVRILKYFKGDAKIWADAHNDNWADFNEFERAFKNKYWSEEKQEGLRSTCLLYTS